MWQGPKASEALFKKSKKHKSKKTLVKTKAPFTPSQQKVLSNPTQSLWAPYLILKIQRETYNSLKGNIPLTDMEPIHTTIVVLSRSGAKYQVDETQSTRLSNEEEVITTGEEMDEDIQAAEEVRTPSPKQDQPKLYHSAVKDLQTLALKQEEKLAAWTKSSTNMAWNFGSRMTIIEICQTALKSEVFSLRQDTSEIKSMMKEIYQAFKGQPSLAPSGSVTPTRALTNILANVEGENTTYTASEEPYSHTEEETEVPTMESLISSIPPTQDQPITSITTHPKISHAALRTDKGKRIATESDKDPLKKLMPILTIIRPDPDEEVKVPYIINEKIYYLTDREIQAFLDNEEKIKKVVEEAKLHAMSKPEDEMLRLQGLGFNTPSGVPYIEDEIMAIVRGGKQRGHIPDVGRVLSGQRTVIPPSPPCTHSFDVAKLKKREKLLTKNMKMFMKLFRRDDKFSQMLTQLESQLVYGGGRGSGGCGDDEPGDDDDGEDGEDEDDS
nr:hypothetical protein [Tanacetum cinerariifolium]